HVRPRAGGARRDSGRYPHGHHRRAILPLRAAAPARAGWIMSAAIEVKSVGMRIRSATLLDRIDLEVRPGETVAIVGPNGAGKSTLLRILSGDLTPTAGTVLLRGVALRSYSADRLAAHRAVLSQHVSISFPFTVEEVVRMGAGEMARAKAQPLVDAMLD